VMPNHVHGILFVGDSVGAKNLSPLQRAQQPRGTSKTIGSIVRGFKIGVTKWFRKNMVGAKNLSPLHVWQRNYYEHIIRNEAELNRIREYIINNPAGWDADQENPICLVR